MKKQLKYILLGTLVLQATALRVTAEDGSYTRSPPTADKVDMDQLFSDANSGDPAVYGPARAKMDEIVKRNPTGKRKVGNEGVSLVLPSWKWQYHNTMEIHGVSVNFNEAGGNSASVTVDKVPGLGEGIIDSFNADLPKEATVSRVALANYGPFSGKGTKLTATIPGGLVRHVECIVFYPKERLEKHYISTVLDCSAGSMSLEKELISIVASVNAE